MIKQFWNSFKKFRLLWGFVLVLAVMVLVSKADYQKRAKIVYPQELDTVIATVEGQDITLRDFAIYVAHQEAEVEKSAMIYDPKRPEKYWNIHTNGTFLKFQARDEAVIMAIHDELFYQLAGNWGITLTEEEVSEIRSVAKERWEEYTLENIDKKLGITEEEIFLSMQKIAIAEKSQFVHAEWNGVKYEQYHVSEEEFFTFLNQYEYEVNEKVVERLDFGNITLEH